jgi:Cu/Ag efflux pump CusA
MLRWIVERSLRARRLVVGATVALALLALWQFKAVEADVLPEFTPPTVEVQTEALGLSAAEVEQLITVPLEQDLLNGVAWLDTIRSESVPGLSSIELIFEPGTPILRARQVVQERLTQAHALPNVSKPPQMLQPVSSTSRVMMIGLSSTELSAIEQSVLARWTIQPKLLGVPGVANVSIFGMRERQLQVQVDPERLQAQGVTLDQIIATTGNALWVSPLTFLEASTPGTGGFIDTPNQRLGIQHVLPINSPTDLAAVTVEDTEGKPLRLGDVTTVAEDHQPLIGDALPGEDDNGLLLVVDKFPGANTENVTEGVEDALDALAPGLKGLQIDPSVYRPAGYVQDSAHNLALMLAIGGLIGFAVLGLLFTNWRSLLIGGTSVMASVAVGAVVLYLLHATINSMVLAGLVAGLTILVDDAVVGAEGILRRLRHSGSHDEAPTPASLVGRAVVQNRRPLLWAAVMTAVVFLPLFFLDNLAGDAFLPEVALAYGLALLASTVVAVTTVPA